MAKINRKNKTEVITKAVVHYFVHLKFGVSVEIGVESWAKLKADLLALSWRKEIVVIEVKSCKSDFQTDRKWHKYLPFCHRMYFAVHHTDISWMDKNIDKLKEKGVGILVLQPNGYIKVYKNASKRTVDPEVLDNLVLRMAWRGAQYSKRNVPRRVRMYIDESTSS